MRPARQSTIVARPGSIVPLGGLDRGNSFGDPFADDDRGISLYTETPDLELTIREFEELTCNRLKVLHAFDRLSGYENTLQNASSSDVKGKILPELHNSRLDLAASVPGKFDEYHTLKAEFLRRDSISHFALRLAFCKTRDAREWFLRQEQKLFVLRFDSLSVAAQETFMTRSGIPCKRFDQRNWEGLTLGELQNKTPGAKIWSDSQGTPGPPVYETVFYEMPFFEVHPSLISQRRVVIRQGKAFVPSSALKLIMAMRFKDQLNAGLDSAFTALPRVLADPRVGGFLRLLQDHGLQLLVAPKSGSAEPGEKLSLDNFEEFLVRSFSPCMRRLVEAQREQRKHLKHAGRLQLRPFLKDAGFSFDESVRWWRQELTKDSTITVTDYEKNYLYDLEHSYGKKGHFQGSHCFGCPKIIGFEAEGAGKVHGCPFKMEMPAIKQMLHKWRVPEKSVAEIEKLVVNGKHYQLACIEYFKATHQGHDGDGVGNSPKDYFQESCAHHLKKAEKAGSAKSISPTKAAVIDETPKAIAAGA